MLEKYIEKLRKRIKQLELAAEKADEESNGDSYACLMYEILDLKQHLKELESKEKENL